jgi:hypothetical protein
MTMLLEALKRAADFVERHPKLERSHDLKKESESLGNALRKYNAKAEEMALSFTPNYAETSALLEGEAKSRVTVEFIKSFTQKNCSSPLVCAKSDKKARTALLILAARDGKLEQLKKALDQNQKYRERFQRLLEAAETEIKTKLIAMPAGDFKGLVTAVGLDALKTQSGAVSTSKASREKALKQILRDKASEELMSGLGGDA